MRQAVRWLALLALCAGVPGTADAARAPGPGRAAIASAHPLATEAGLEVLRAGGNAFDAAVAVASALAVVEPTGSGLGGGAFFLLHRARDGREAFIDARERAPAAATRDMFLDAAGNPDRERAQRSALAAGIPGEVAGLGELARHYGRLPIARSLQPAIRLAREGFPLYPHLQEALGFMRAPWSGNRPTLVDVHGAGAQRSDPKQGRPDDYPQGWGPQGDVRRIYNLARLVRNAERTHSPEENQ